MMMMSTIYHLLHHDHVHLKKLHDFLKFRQKNVKKVKKFEIIA